MSTVITMAKSQQFSTILPNTIIYFMFKIETYQTLIYFMLELIFLKLHLLASIIEV